MGDRERGGSGVPWHPWQYPQDEFSGACVRFWPCLFWLRAGALLGTLGLGERGLQAADASRRKSTLCPLETLGNVPIPKAENEEQLPVLEASFRCGL